MVRAAKSKSGHDRIIKAYSKSDANCPLDNIKDEFKILKSLDHAKVMRLYDIFEDWHNVYIVGSTPHAS